MEQLKNNNNSIYGCIYTQKYTYSLFATMDREEFLQLFFSALSRDCTPHSALPRSRSWCRAARRTSAAVSFQMERDFEKTAVPRLAIDPSQLESRTSAFRSPILRKYKLKSGSISGSI